MAINEGNGERAALPQFIRRIEWSWGPGKTSIAITKQQLKEFKEQRKTLGKMHGIPPDFSNYHAFEIQANAYQELDGDAEEGEDPIILPPERIAKVKSDPLTTLNVKGEQHDEFLELKSAPVQRGSRLKTLSSYVMYDLLLVACDRLVAPVDTRDSNGMPDFDEEQGLSWNRQPV